MRFSDWQVYYDEMQNLTTIVSRIMYFIPESRNLTHDQFIAQMRRLGCTKASDSISRARRKAWEKNPSIKPTDESYKQHKTAKRVGIQEWVK